MVNLLPQKEKIVVIGAGLGGLAAALRLCHAGCDVAILDSHGAPGGKMRVIDTVAGPVDAGPTVLTLRPVFDRLFADLGERLDDHVTLRLEPLLARHFWPDGSTLDLFADPQRSAQAISDFAGPKAAQEYRRFADGARRLFEAFESPMMLAPQPSQAALTAHVMRHPGLIPLMAPQKTMASALAVQFTDPRLRQLFGRYATYVGGSPYLSPAILSLVSHAEAKGVWLVEGGMHRLAQAMAGLIERRGGRFHFATHAAHIERSGAAIRAVITADGTRLPCTRVVFNGDPRALASGLLGDDLRAAVPLAATEPRSLSAQVWAFAATPHGRDLAHHNVFFGADPRSEFDALAQGRNPVDPTVYVCAQDRTSGTSPPAIERFETIVNAPPVAPRIATDERPQSCRHLTFQTLANRGLTFSPGPPDNALTTPQAFERMFPASLGSLYGRSPHGLMAAFQRPTARSRVPGLYLAGGGAHPGAGVPMATLSGGHAAAAILTDLGSISMSRPTDTPGGISTA
ncbi:MAG: phytoene desaturase [Rhodobacterales bacterium]|nr:phytoene desaturase [Rhodobacterales bacterium]